jgi:ankyrin repeat protein
MACTHIKNCELFVQFALNPALGIWQSAYCNDDYSVCARYQTSLEGKVVPLSLLPNGKKITVNHSQDELASTALFNCIAKNRLPLARSLIKTVGVDINCCNVEGTTALMAAVEFGSIEMIKLLLSFNPDTSLRNADGQTAYDLAMAKHDDARIELLAQYR